MLLQTNSYIVPKEKRTEHTRLVKRFRAVMARLGCTDFQIYEQAGPNWSTEVGGRFVQIMRFRDREHQRSIKDAEQSDASAQDLVREFCELINFAYQHQQGLATTAFYIEMGVLAGPSGKKPEDGSASDPRGNDVRGNDLPVPGNGAPTANGSATPHNIPTATAADDDLSDLTSTGPFRPTAAPLRAGSNRHE